MASDTKYIVNELLAYVSYYAASTLENKLHNAVTRFFVPAEVENAKEVLWDAYGESKSNKKYNRKDSSQRTACEANITDIIQYIKDMPLSNVCFVAANFERIPKWAPNEINLFALAERVSLIESELAEVKTNLVSLNQNSVQSMTTVNLNQNSTKEIFNPSSNNKPTYFSKAAAAAKDPTLALIPFRQSGNVGETGVKRASHDIVAPNNDTRNLGAKIPTNRQRPKPIVGKKVVQNVKGECHKTDLFLYRISQETNDSEIRKLFTDAKINIFDFSRVSHDSAKMKSFKVTVSLSDVNLICNDDFLPQDVMCRRFYKPKPRLELQDDNASTSST